MKSYLFIFYLIFIAENLIWAQHPNQYQSADNSWYWQNRKPFAGYWQQDVHYQINADINERTNIITASEELRYSNNSPDTLYFVYFHLYQNAFVKGSHLEELHRANHQSIKNLGKYQQQGLGTVVTNLLVDGKSVKTTLDNTLLKVYLNKPLYPNQSVTFNMNFKTYFDRGDYRRRMGLWYHYGFPHYNGVHWYPRISVYDMKKGWDTDQHLNKELYGDYGQFDVNLTFAANYVVEATGQLLNPETVYADGLREKIDLKNFAQKPWNEKPSTIVPYDSLQRKTWRYRAINVHDFAFTADPFYRIAEENWNGVQCIGLALEEHASKWKNSAQYVSKIIQTFSTDFGMYEYPKMVAADANDGMEYPMLTLDGGADPDYRGLLVHEIGHNWFYGMIGNNETYRAALDEGFTQFLTAWGLQKIDGPYGVSIPPKNKYVAARKTPMLVRDKSVYMGYMRDAIKHEDPPLNTHSNDFHSAIGHENGYGHVYYKTATMLYNLQYVLGDSLFIHAMQHYVKKWKFAHPYFEDFRQSIIEYTHQDLNWFFDQWLETTKSIDYGITSIKKGYKKGDYTIRLKRYGDMQMPIDITLFDKQGKSYNYHVPNTVFQKNTTANILPQWYGWDIMYPSYQFKVSIPAGLQYAQIDTSGRLADVDMMNNYKRPGLKLAPESQQLKWENFIQRTPTWKKYQGTIRPDIWWNAIDGLKIGMHYSGHYMQTMRKLYTTVWFNSRVFSLNQYAAYEGESWWKNVSPIDYTLRYETPLVKWNPKISWGVDSRKIDGFVRHQLYAWYQLSQRTQCRIDAVSLYRVSDILKDYLFDKQEWMSYATGNGVHTKRNSYVQLQLTHQYRAWGGQGNIKWQLRAPLSYNYAYTQAEIIQRNAWKKFDIKTRIMGRYGWNDQIPTESALYLQGANPEEMMENKFSRSQGVIPASWGGYSANQFAFFHTAGGLNLRGYNGYYAVDENNKTTYINYKGQSGAAVNMEIDVDKYFSAIRPKFTRNWLHVDAYIFADAGLINRGIVNTNQISQVTPTQQLSKVRADAGLGLACTIKKWGILETVPPFTVRLDWPLWLSAPPAAKPEYIQLNHFIIGIGRCF